MICFSFLFGFIQRYLKITQNDKFSVKVEPFTGNPLCHPL